MPSARVVAGFTRSTSAVTATTASAIPPGIITLSAWSSV